MTKTYLANHPSAMGFIFNEPVYQITETKQFDSFDYEGDNNKYVLVLYLNEQGKLISHPQRDFLMKILGAVGLKPEDVALVNLGAYQGVTALDLKKFFSPSKMLVFSEDVSSLGVSQLEKHYLPSSAASMKVVRSQSIDNILHNVDSKKQLWMALKQLFNV
ncbi:MAG: hypothetical protein ACJATA_000038 [Sphingobacteriales bacterium]|jgi:hypothetical protein